MEARDKELCYFEVCDEKDFEVNPYEDLSNK